MIVSIILLSIFLIVSIVINIVLYMYLYNTSSLLFAIEDFISDISSDIELASNKIEKISKMPVATSSPEVQFIVETVNKVRDMVSSISDRFSDYGKRKKGDKT